MWRRQIDGSGRAAKHAGESKHRTHIQSIVPSAATKAAFPIFPIMA